MMQLSREIGDLLTGNEVAAISNSARSAILLCSFVGLWTILVLDNKTPYVKLFVETRGAIKWLMLAAVCSLLDRFYWNLAIFDAAPGESVALWAEYYRAWLFPLTFGWVLGMVMGFKEFVPPVYRLKSMAAVYVLLIVGVGVSILLA